MRRRTPLALATLALVLAVGGCASTMPETPGARRAADIEELKARLLELSRQVVVAELEIGRLRQQVAALEARVGGAPRPTGQSGGGAAPPPVARAAPSSPAMAPSPPRRAPRVEETELPPDSVAVTPAPAAAQPPASARAPGDRPASSTAAPAAPLPVPREAQAIYDEAYTLYHQGRYNEAERRFEEFLAATPPSELSDNAQYWIGAARLAREDFRGALAAFRRTVELFPEGNKVPDALFKMGQALEELGDPGEARTVYQELARRYPDTAAATLAGERLDRLRR